MKVCETDNVVEGQMFDEILRLYCMCFRNLM